MAGGRHASDPGGGDAVFQTVPYAKLGDLGTQVLAKGDAVEYWTAGSTVEVAWGTRMLSFPIWVRHYSRLALSSSAFNLAYFHLFPVVVLFPHPYVSDTRFLALMCCPNMPKRQSYCTVRDDVACIVTQGIRFNHGGGYSYRLCPASEPLTEECFQKVHSCLCPTVRAVVCK